MDAHKVVVARRQLSLPLPPILPSAPHSTRRVTPRGGGGGGGAAAGGAAARAGGVADQNQ